MKIVIGNNSFISNGIKTFSNDYVKMSVDEFLKFECKDYTVINCSMNPLFNTEPYTEQNDVDLSVARKVSNDNSRMIMISTRKVYGKSLDLKTYSENDSCAPFDYYSENKFISENIVSKILDNLVIVRASNIFGYEIGRKSFMGFCLTQLTNYGIIEYELDPSLRRDFLSLEFASSALCSLGDSKISGIFNLSSGVGTEIGDIATSLISGYGSGKFISCSCDSGEQFILDNSKLSKVLSIKNNQDILSDVKKIGKYARYCN
jgi:hypothetical protein